MRQYLRILMSHGDFKHAKLASSYILDDHLHAKYPEQSYILLEALNYSMIMAYCRPFSGNDSEIPDLPNRFLTVLDDDERLIHETVMQDRNKLLAHSDYDGRQMEPILWSVAGKDIVMPITNWALAPLTENATKTFLSAVTKLLQATFDERFRLEPELIPFLRVANEQNLL